MCRQPTTKSFQQQINPQQFAEDDTSNQTDQRNDDVTRLSGVADADKQRDQPNRRNDRLLNPLWQAVTNQEAQRAANRDRHTIEKGAAQRVTP